MIIHHLHRGVTACFMGGMPRDWPADHRWAYTWSDVTCAKCLGVSRHVGVSAVPYVEFELFQFLTICGFLLNHKYEMERIDREFVENWRKLSGHNKQL